MNKIPQCIETAVHKKKLVAGIIGVRVWFVNLFIYHYACRTGKKFLPKFLEILKRMLQSC